MTAKLTILIVGGYGTFGGRIVELLEHDPRLVILVAGRSWEKAHRHCSARTAAKARLVAAAFDRDGDLARQLEMLQPDILIDASGPFQAYGNRPYALIEACIARRIHYLDLADGSDFVTGVSAFNDDALAAVYVLSGVSSFPVLTAAAVRRLSFDMQRVDSIRGGIAPSPYARVGQNVIRAIAGYAGRRVLLKRDGRPGFGYPFTEQIRFTVAPPGHVPLRSTMFSLVDVPDLAALAELWPEARTVWMGAGPVPAVLHRILIALAWLTRLHLAPSLSPLSPLMHFAANHFVWGEHRGGMFVEVQGVASAGEPLTRSWHLIAEADDGPLIPSMAVAAIIRKALDGKPPARGARAATRDLELEDYEPLFATRRIVTGLRDDLPRSAPLQKRVLAAAWDRLPGPIAAMHDVTKERVAEGRADVDRGKGVLATAIAAAIGLPKPGRDLPVTVRFLRVNDAEIWTRTFADRSFSSTQFEGRGRAERLLCERFGPITFKMAMAVEGDRVHLVLRGWALFGIPLPRWLGPRATACETVKDGRFRFHVEISLPWGALIVRYQGWLVLVDRKTRTPAGVEGRTAQLAASPVMFIASLAALTTSAGIA
jgi:hypothetical protein